MAEPPGPTEAPPRRGYTAAQHGLAALSQSTPTSNVASWLAQQLAGVGTRVAGTEMPARRMPPAARPAGRRGRLPGARAAGVMN